MVALLLLLLLLEQRAALWCVRPVNGPSRRRTAAGAVRTFTRAATSAAVRPARSANSSRPPVSERRACPSTPVCPSVRPPLPIGSSVFCSSFDDLSFVTHSDCRSLASHTDMSLDRGLIDSFFDYAFNGPEYKVTNSKEKRIIS